MRSRTVGKYSMALAVTVLMGGLVSGCGSGGSTTNSGGSGSTSNTSQKLVVGYEADATSLDPGQVTDINSMVVLNQIYDTLVKTNSQGKIVPDLATSWNVSKDGMTYTFTLQSGVKFSDGTTLTAADVVYTFERMLDKNNPGYQFGPYPFGGLYFGDVASVTALSPTQVQFKMSTPNASLIDNLTTPTGMIVEKSVALKDGKNFASIGAGTGPFMVKKWTKGVDLQLVDNPNYWGTKPKLQEIDFTPIVQQSQRSQDLQSNTVQMIINPQPNSISGLKSGGFQVAEASGPHIWWVGMNLHEKPFSNPLVRQAINYAINRPAMIKGILYGTAIPANQPLSPGQLGYNSNLNTYAYNPTKAKQLLAQAGYPNGFTATLEVPTSGSGMESPVQLGTAIQGYLKAVGINLKINELDWGTYIGRLGKGATGNKWDMWELSWMDGALDPSMVMGPLLDKSSFPPGFNTGYYSDPKVNQLLAEGIATLDPTKRSQIYQQIEQLINKDAPWVFVDHTKQVVAYSNSVQGFALNPTFPYIFSLDNVSMK